MNIKKLLTTVILMAMACAPLWAQEQEQSEGAYLDAYIEMARSDIRTQKTALIAEAVPLTDSESTSFWPLYRKYDLELSRLGDERLAIIKDYANQYQSMTDVQARDLAERNLAWEAKRVELKKKYFKEFSKVLPAVKATRIMQIESRINILIDLQVASEVPLME